MPMERILLKPGVHKALWGEEAWEVSAHESDPSTMVDGPFAGRRLNEVFPQFPLLFKTIRANDAFNAGREAVKAAVRGETAEKLLVRHDLKAGDIVFIPGGLVHAIGGGSTLYEVQQSSNTTFRLYDWGRVGADGKPRQLHLDAAVKAMDCSLPPPVPCSTLDTPYFLFRQTRLAGEIHVGGCGRFLVIRSADGGFSIDGEEFPDGSSVLLPPSVAGVLRADGAWLLLTEFAP